MFVLTYVPSVLLGDGVSIPQFGLGTYELPPNEASSVVQSAIELGYRHIDTASLYANEREVGRAIASSGIKREEFFVTTKLWNSDQPKPREAFERSLDLLSLDYVDLYLIHWPCPPSELYINVWEVLLELKESGRAKSVGVSNFLSEHIDKIKEAGFPLPSVNQIELHPWLQQRELVLSCRNDGIQIESWGPFARFSKDLDAFPELTRPAKQYGKTPAQVILRWHIQKGYVVFPKTVHAERLRQNIDIFDFDLTPDEISGIDSLDAGFRTGPDPSSFRAGLD
nr:aldo/keto reductase [Tropheryma whipplei]